MKITLESTNSELLQFLGKNESGHEVHLSSNDTAAGPMQSVLMAIAACSTIDIVMILQKMRQELRDIKVNAEATRSAEVPKIFTAIHLHFKLYGDIKEAKAEQAIALSIEKYCSVSKMLEKSAEISTSFELLP